MLPRADVRSSVLVRPSISLPTRFKVATGLSLDSQINDHFEVYQHENQLLIFNPMIPIK